jgi:hypothetical protein
VQFGEALVWQRLDDKKACRIKFSKEFDSYDRENWQEMTAWLVKYIVKLEGAFNGQLGALKNL